MLGAALKAIQALQLLKDKSTQNLGKKIVIVLFSPVIALVFLIGGIFSDGIDFNHNLVSDLYHGVPVSTTNMDAEQKKQVTDIEAGIKLLNVQIDETNKTLSEDTVLDSYLVKGFYIGIMLTDQSIVLDQEKAKIWTLCFTEEKEAASTENVEKKDEEGNKEEDKTETPSTNRIAVFDRSDIYKQIERDFSITLKDNTKTNMESVYSGLMGGTTNAPVTTLSKEEIDKLIKNLPKETSELRKNLVIQAADAVGKIPLLLT